MATRKCVKALFSVIIGLTVSSNVYASKLSLDCSVHTKKFCREAANPYVSDKCESFELNERIVISLSDFGEYRLANIRGSIAEELTATALALRVREEAYYIDTLEENRDRILANLDRVSGKLKLLYWTEYRESSAGTWWKSQLSVEGICRKAEVAF